MPGHDRRRKRGQRAYREDTDTNPAAYVNWRAVVRGLAVYGWIPAPRVLERGSRNRAVAVLSRRALQCARAVIEGREGRRSGVLSDRTVLDWCALGTLKEGIWLQ